MTNVSFVIFAISIVQKRPDHEASQPRNMDNNSVI
jgi:hypothetical protein